MKINYKTLITDKVFYTYLKDLFYSKKIDLGVYQESYFNGLTVLWILEKDPENDKNFWFLSLFLV